MPSWFPGFAGVAFAILFVTGSLILDDPGHDDSEEIVNEFYGESGNRVRVIIGSYLLAFSGLAFLAFVTSVSARLTASNPELRVLAVSSAGVFAALLVAAAAAHLPTYAASIEAFDEPQSELTRAMVPHLAYGFLLFGLLAASVSIACLCRLGRVGQQIPRWLVYSGYATAVLLLFGILFTPMLALPLWALAAGVTLILRPLPDPLPASPALPPV